MTQLFSGNTDENTTTLVPTPPNQQQHLEYIRANTAYKSFRHFVEIVTVLGYICAGMLALVGVLALVTTVFERDHSSGGVAVAMLGFAVATAFISRVTRDAALMLADLTDSTIHAHSKPIWRAE